MEWYQSLLFVIILLTLSLSVFYSISHRRQRDPAAKGLRAARMNINMGLMLIALAVQQAVSFEMSTLRLVLSTIFALVGLFNLFAGLKNRTYFRSLQK